MSHAPPLVRLYDEGDFDQLTEMWHEVNRTAYWYVPLHQEHTLDDARAFFRSVVVVRNQVWVAWLDDRPVGLLAFDGLRISQFAVRTGMQRRGIGSTLLRQMLSHSTGDMRLFTFQRNKAARSFYEKFGFRPVAFGISPAPESEPDVEYLLTRN